MAEIRKYHKDGRIRCEVSASRFHVVHRYDVHESGDEDDLALKMKLLPERQRLADGTKGAGYVLFVPHSEAKPGAMFGKPDKSAYYAEKARYESKG